MCVLSIKVLIRKKSENSRRRPESVVISKTSYIKQRSGVYQISPLTGEHHTERTQNQNRKRIGKKNVFSLCATIHLRIFSFCLSLSLCLLALSSPKLQPRHHNIDNFLRHHIIVNIFPSNKLYQNPVYSNPPDFFLIYSLKSIFTFKTKNL